MDWSARIVVPFVAAFVLLTAVVVLAVLRLGGVITWPARWVVFVLFALLLAPVALVFLAATTDAEKRSEDGGVSN
jgi:multisubunit Na+/H+ antiporter MnhG subunit